MFRIKRIDIYTFKNFISLFFVTFFICLFIVLMQFLWLHINELVGKGLGVGVLLEFFLYALLSLVPLALPLAILLASLMSFGNMGENLELLAMKSAGVSLFRIMRSLMVFIVFVCVGAFFFSNNVIPVTQKKMWTLLYSIKIKSPDLEIPVGEFYSGIAGMNLYVRERDHETKLLKNIMIYDFSNGFENATVTTADSARISLTGDKMNLRLTLFSGESFENIRPQDSGYGVKNVPYRRESFSLKEVLIDFDANFNRVDESLMSDQHISKNFMRLTHDIDSVNAVRDTLRTRFATEVVNDKYFGRVFKDNPVEPTVEKVVVSDADSLIFYNTSKPKLESIVQSAYARAQSMMGEVQYNRIIVNDADLYYVRHSLEWHRKFTLSFACLIFFFIGAPLGAIIRKGGLGMPVVISVVLFIIYYIIDTAGQKMARESIWDVWQGMWLSSMILLPVGFFLTYKAATDSAIFNPDAYKIIFKQRWGKLQLWWSALRKQKE